MTVIAWDGKILAADRQINTGELKHAGTKIKRLDTGEVAAWNGIIDAGLILLDWYENGARPKDFPFDPKDEAMTDLVIASANGVKWYCQSPHPHHTSDGVMAWGSGALAASAILRTGAGAIRAVEITCEVSNSCGLGVDYYEVSR